MLADFVGSLWSLSDAPAHTQERILPTGTVELVLNLGDDEFRIYRADGVSPCQRFPGAIVSGPYDRPFTIDTREHASVIGVHFKAGGAGTLLGVPPGTIGAAHAELAALWGPVASELREQLGAADTSAARFAILEGMLTARLRSHPAGRPLVSVALGLLRRPGARVGRVAGQLGVSRRRLEEVFRAEVGMAPRTFARVRRFQRALALARSTTTPDWGTLAVTAGYFDQSHLIRDFREFSGFPPGGLQSRMTAPVKDNHVPLT